MNRNNVFGSPLERAGFLRALAPRIYEGGGPQGRGEPDAAGIHLLHSHPNFNFSLNFFRFSFTSKTFCGMISCKGVCLMKNNNPNNSQDFEDLSRRVDALLDGDLDQ